MDKVSLDFSLFGTIKNLNLIKQNKENMDNNTDNDNIAVTITVIIIFVLALALFIWCGVVLATFKLPREILIISIILFVISGPVIPLILAYVFKNKKLS